MFFVGLKISTLIVRPRYSFMENEIKDKIEQTERFMRLLWTIFLIILYACSFFIEYNFSGEQEEVPAGKVILTDLQHLFFFALMGMGFLIDLVRMRENRNNAYIFLLMTLFLGGFSGGIGAMQAQFILNIMGRG